MALTLIITAISGANFFGVLLFWPTQSYNMYGHDPVGVGLRALPLGLGILTGACVVLVLLSVLKGRIRELMIVSSIMMTAGKLADDRKSRLILIVVDRSRSSRCCHRRQPASFVDPPCNWRSWNRRHCRPSLNHHDNHLPR